MHLHDLRAFFDRVVVISLDRRPERWQKFLATLPPGWPFCPPLRFPAVDGTRVEIPAWWTEGTGAWGCYLSHVQIIEDCLDEQVGSVLILEDDASFEENFSDDVRQFLQHLPDDWQFMYFGGQHIELHEGTPRQVNEWVYRPYNVNRTHAYALRGREMLERVHQYLVDTDNWKAKHHIDHHLGEFQKTLAAGIYVPKQWLVAQGDGESDVSRRKLGLRRFRGAEEIANPVVDMPMVAVLGPYSGGTSVVAGILHKLGIRMGSVFERPDGTNTGGNFEAQELAGMCRKMYREPWMTEQVDRDARVRLLKIWAAGHCRASRATCSLIGGKHPALCLMGPELMEAWNRPLLISVERERDAVVNSLVRRDWGWPLEACLLVSEQLVAARDHFLSTVDAPCLRLSYEELVREPRAVIDRLCRFLQYRPDSQSLSQALKFVVPRESSQAR